MSKSSIMPLTVAIVAALLVPIDSLISPFFHPFAGFIWVAFVSWTVFFSASTKERLIAIPNYAIGFLCANLIVLLSNPIGIAPPLLAATIAVFAVNGLVLYLAPFKLFSIPAIFVGIAMTFARGGVSLEMQSPSLLLLIITYGILGLLCGYVCTKVSSKFLGDGTS